MSGHGSSRTAFGAPSSCKGRSHSGPTARGPHTNVGCRWAAAPGSPGTLLHRGSLRTGRAVPTASGSSKRWRVVRWCGRTLSLSFLRTASSVPVTIVGVYLVPRLGQLQHVFVTVHPPHVSPLSRPGTRPGIRPVIRQPRVEDRVLALLRFPAAFRPPALASWASCSRSGMRLSLRSACRRRTRRRTRTGFPRSPRMRYGRVGCPLCPGSHGVPTTAGIHDGRRLPPHNGPAPTTPALPPDPGCQIDEASTRVQRHSPFRPSPRL
jgi:hypothetical protein